jgi:hypothetical protein
VKVILTVPCEPAGGPAGCLPLVPLLDRPFLQHAVEVLAGRGLTDVHVVLGRHADAVERLLGTGARWGCTFHYHLTPDPDRPASALAAAAGDGPVLLGKLDRLPLLPDPLPAGRTLFEAGGEWTGWAVADAADVAALPAALPWAALESLLAARRADRVAVGRVLSMRTPADVPEACRVLLGGEFPGTLAAGREVRRGVRVGRGATVAPSAVLVPPVFVGEGTVVRADAQVGPDAYVGAGCLIDTGAAVRDSVVLPGTHVGPGVELDGVIADRDHLIDPRGADVVCVGPDLLGELPAPLGLGSLAGRAVERTAAAALFVLGLPVLALAALWLKATRPGPVFWRRRFVRTPCGPAEAGWREGSAFALGPPRDADGEFGWVVEPSLRGLVRDLLPALPAVAVGRLRLVGPPPRSAELARRLRPDRRLTVLAAPAGLVSETGLAMADLTLDEAVALDAYQAQTASAADDLGRLGRFLAAALTRWRSAPAAGVEPILAPAAA